jgi:hypothetical protein
LNAIIDLPQDQEEKPAGAIKEDSMPRHAQCSAPRYIQE